MDQGILIINYGSQYTQLIARRIRELGVYSEVVSPQSAMQRIAEKPYKGIIFSGGPSSVYDKGAPTIDVKIFDLGIPILGICYGMQLIVKTFGGKVKEEKTKEYGKSDLECNGGKHKILRGVNKKSLIWASHGDEVVHPGKDFDILAKSNKGTCIAIIKHKTKPFYAFQFHPEVTHTAFGSTMLKNFVFDICACQANWKTDFYVASTIQQIKTEVKNKKVILGLSGGVDSSVAAVLTHRAIGKNLTCIFVDTGLLRLDEAQKIITTYSKYLKLKVICVDASKIFLRALKDVTDPEEKRKIIGKKFIQVFEKEALKIKGVDYLVQGTIYPDVIESSVGEGHSQTIKSHHNVGGLPSKMKFKIIEPLRRFFKDEVRQIGKHLGIPLSMINRHPFPGPGLAIRIVGKITQEKLTILQKADDIFIHELVTKGLYDSVSQAFVALLPVQSVGVQGDNRTYAYTAVIRAVNTIDFMTATWSHLPYDFLENVSSKICNQVKGINRVVYDISSKPPSTIEWE